MKANKDPQVQIKDADKDCYHVRLARYDGTPQNPIKRAIIQIFTKKDFDGFKRTTKKQAIGITGWHEAEIVHDPTFVEAEQKSAAKSEADDNLAKPAKKTAQAKG